MRRPIVPAASLGVAIGISLCCIGLAQAQYPNKPLRMITPYAAGGSTDLHGRMLAQRMQTMLGQTIVVEAKVGGSGIVATLEAIRAKPDGYTLLLGTSTNLIIAPAAVKPPPYDAIKELATIAIIGIQPTMIVAHPELPAKSLKELIALLKANPGKYNYGIAAGLSVNQLMMEMFKKQAGNLNVVAVSYKGTNEVTTDLMAGRIQLAAYPATGAMDLYRTGRVRILATCSEVRLKTAPDIPTAIEGGLPDLVVLTFNAVSLAAATPKSIVDRLNQVIVKIMASDAYIQDLDKLGMEPFVGSTPEKASQFISDVATKWTPQLRELAEQQQ